MTGAPTGSAGISISISSTARDPYPSEDAAQVAHAEDPFARFAHAVALLASSIDEEMAPRWDGLTGLQVLFVKRIRRAGPGA